MKDYRKQYLDPRWQKKRLEILERDNWMCQCCADESETLHVHHKLYISGKDVWDYPNELLVTLCKECHEREKETIADSINELIKAVKTKFLSGGITTFADAISKFEFSNFSYIDDVVVHIVSWALTNPKMNKLMQEEYFKSLSTDKK